MIIDPELPEIAREVIERFRSARTRCTTAESCTGGLVSMLLTTVPGASDVYERGFITYSNQSKLDMLDVKNDTLKKFGAVSMQTALEMALGGLHHGQAGACIAITGVAGPDASERKPAGLAYISVANHFEKKPFSKKFLFQNSSRNETRNRIAKAALEALRNHGIRRY